MHLSGAFEVSGCTTMPRKRIPLCASQDRVRSRPREVLLNRRHSFLTLPVATALLHFSYTSTFPSKAAIDKKPIDPKYLAAFNKALEDSGDAGKADASWSAVIELDPTNSYAWSNRGTVRLQQGLWQGAKDDFEKALELESVNGSASGILLNNLGNAKGALGDWKEAMSDFKEASLDPEITPIALANLALALFQIGETEQGIRQVQTLLRRDPNFLDMRCALTAMLWSVGKEAEAESEWKALQSISDGLGGLIYRRDVAVKRVQGRWPPRAVAALDAFLRLSRTGKSLDYDKKQKTYNFTNTL